MTYPPLPVCHKGMHPFKLGTTSFIYPDHLIPNVKMLGPFVDEIELLIFESIPKDRLPAPGIVRELKTLADDFNLIYDIHLPADISMTDPEPLKRHLAVDTMKKVMNLTALLEPVTWTLHLPFDEYPRDAQNKAAWQERAFESVRQLLETGVHGPDISIENMDYPLKWADHIISDLNLSVCMDFGHLVCNHHDIPGFFEKYRDRLPLIHLHGANDQKDHISLDQLAEHDLNMAWQILDQFQGSVSIEVFSLDNLLSSLALFEKQFRHFPQNKDE